MFQFEADPRASKRAVNPGAFPLVCRSCGQITVNGTPLVFPEAFENQAKDMAEAAAAAGEAAVVELASDPNARVANYFSKVYREAYLDGFLRCLAFYQHNAKEGKLKRLRELWSSADRNPRDDAPVAYVNFFKEAFEEFDQLMMLGPVPD
jgi:hypothetical protein